MISSSSSVGEMNYTVVVEVSTYCPDRSVDAACSLMTPHTDALNYGVGVSETR